MIVDVYWAAPGDVSEIRPLLFGYFVNAYPALHRPAPAIPTELEDADRVQWEDPLAAVGRNGAVLLARSGNRAVGMMFLEFADGAEGSIRRATLSRLYVAEQRQGIGSRLIETALALCEHQGYDDISLVVIRKRQSLLKWYARYGFEMIGPLDGDDDGWRLDWRDPETPGVVILPAPAAPASIAVTPVVPAPPATTTGTALPPRPLVTV